MLNEFTAFHFCGAFTATVLLLYLCRRLRPLPVLVFIAVCCIGLEVYQWFNEPMYAGKVLDTFMDIIADGIGVTAGYLIIKQGHF